MALLKRNINANAEASIYTWLCVGIVYSMIFFTYLNSLLIILMTAFWFIFSKKEFDTSSQKTKLLILFISLYLIAVIGLIHTKNTTAGLATLKTQSAIFFFPLIFGMTSVITPSLLRTISFHLLIALSISCIWSLSIGVYRYYLSGDINDTTGENIPLFHAVRPVTMGLLCLTGIIIGFEKIKSSVKNKKILYCFITLASLMILLLGVRLIIFCWILIILYFSLTTISKLTQKLMLIATVMILVFVTGFTVPSVKKQWAELFDNTAKSSIVLDTDSSLNKSWGGKAIRVAIWRCGADILENHLLTGVGTGDVQDSLQQAYEDRKFYFASRYNKYNAHNEYLQITLANGLPGFLILLGCIIYPLVNYRKKVSGNIYLLFLLLFATICLSESILDVNKGIIWYSFFNSIFAFGYLKSDQHERTETK